MEEDNVLSDFKDIEKKLGRNVPESLIRSLAGGHHHHDKHEDRKPATPKNRSNSSDLKRLESKILFLKQEMVGYVVALKMQLQIYVRLSLLGQ